MRRSIVASSCLASALLLGSVGCRTPSSKLPLEQLRADEPTTAPGEVRATVEALPVEAPADLLPPEVPVLVEAIDPAAVLAMLGPLDNVPELAAARAELRDRLGGDPLDPNQWATLGLDSHGPAGLGVLEVAAEGLFGYVSLVDEARFATTLERFAALVGLGDELAAMEVGDARVYRLDRRVSIIVRERVAVMVYVGDPDRAARDHVVSVATLDPRDSLGRAEPYAWARSQIVDADDGLVFVAPAALISQIGAREREGDDYGVRYAEDELARARAAGEPPERIRELEGRVRDEREWQRERAQRDASERELVEALFGSLSAFVAAADLRADGITAHARARTSPANLLRRLFVAPERESPLLTGLDHRPLFVLDGRVDLPVLVELVELVARADGASLASVNTELQQELGVDVLGELIPALAGDGGFAIIQTGAPDPKRLGEVAKVLGLAAHVGLRDPAAIRRMLDAVAQAKHRGGFLTRAPRGDGWVLQVPEWHDVELRVVGDRLLLSTDPGFLRRVRDAERGSLATELSAADHPLGGAGSAAGAGVQRLYGRWLGIVLVDAREPWAQEPEAYLYDLDAHPSLTPEQAAKVPKSKAYKRKRAELDQAVAAMDAFNRQRTRERFELELAFAERLGDAGLQLAVEADGLSMTGQWRFAPGTTPVGLGVQLFSLDQRDDWAEYDRLSAEVYARADELRQIRQADLDAAANKASTR